MIFKQTFALAALMWVAFSALAATALDGPWERVSSNQRETVYATRGVPAGEPHIVLGKVKFEFPNRPFVQIDLYQVNCQDRTELFIQSDKFNQYNGQTFGHYTPPPSQHLGYEKTDGTVLEPMIAVICRGDSTYRRPSAAESKAASKAIMGEVDAYYAKKKAEREARDARSAEQEAHRQFMAAKRAEYADRVRQINSEYPPSKSKLSDILFASQYKERDERLAALKAEYGFTDSPSQSGSTVAAANIPNSEACAKIIKELDYFTSVRAQGYSRDTVEASIREEFKDDLSATDRHVQLLHAAFNLEQADMATYKKARCDEIR